MGVIIGGFEPAKEIVSFVKKAIGFSSKCISTTFTRTPYTSRGEASYNLFTQSTPEPTKISNSFALRRYLYSLVVFDS